MVARKFGYEEVAIDLHRLHLHWGPIHVSTRILKASGSAVFLRCLGRLSHKCVEYGTYVFKPLFAELEWNCFRDLADLVLWTNLSWATNRSHMYLGARAPKLCTHLKTSVHRALNRASSRVSMLALCSKVFVVTIVVGVGKLESPQLQALQFVRVR